MPKTTFSEEIYLRALTGKVVGEAILSEYNKVAVISTKNIICSALSAAAEAVFSNNTNGTISHFIVEENQIEPTIKSVIEFKPEAVLLLFGGETPIEQTLLLFNQTLQELAKSNQEMAIIFHVRIFAAQGLHEAVKEKSVLSFLQNNEIFVYTIDFEKGKLVYNEIYIPTSQKIKLEPILEVALTLEHADLLNRSLRDKTISWVN